MNHVPSPRALEHAQRRGLSRVLAVLLCALLGMGVLAVVAPSAQAADPAVPDHLVISEVNGDQSGIYRTNWFELYNPTDAPIVLGTISDSTVTPNYYMCYASEGGSTCTNPYKLYGTVLPHHHFLVEMYDAAGALPAFPAGVTPDLNFASTDPEVNPSGQASKNIGGYSTGGQLILLDARVDTTGVYPSAANDTAANDADFNDPGHVTWAYGSTNKNLADPSINPSPVVDAMGFDKAGSGALGGAEGWTGAAACTDSNAASCIHGAPVQDASHWDERIFVDGVPQDTNDNAADFKVSQRDPISQVSTRVATGPVDDATIARNGAMTPITVPGRNGLGTLTFSATGLPPGVAIDSSTGVISGTPTTVGTYPVTVTVSDQTPGTGDSVTTTFTLTVVDAVVVDKISDVTLHKGDTFSPIQVKASGGTAPYTYAATGLPSGVSIDSSTGLISGTPTGGAGHYSVRVTVSDSGVGTEALSTSIDFTITELPAASGPEDDDPLIGLRINEVVATGTPADDWVELYNTGAAITGAAVDLTDASGATYAVPAQDIAAGGFVVVDGTDLHAAGLDLVADDTLYLSDPGDTAVLDQTSWTARPSTSWARYPDGTGTFYDAATATKGTTNLLPATADTDHLVVAAVYGADGTAFNSDWVELYNPTDAPIVLGTIDSNGVVTPNYYQCYRGNASSTCSSMKLYGTVQPHHYFLIWNGHNADANVDAHSKGQPPAGITPDLDFRYASNDTNSAATKAANDPSGQSNNGFGGCNTGGQLWLLDASSDGVAPTGDMSSASARTAGVVDGVGWTANGVTEPTAAESKGSATVDGFRSGTNNACVIARKFAGAYPIDADANSTDFTGIQNPSTFTLQSGSSQHVAITPVDDAEISLNEAMNPIHVQAQAVFGDLTYSATGLPDGITIDPSTGVISGTPASTDALRDYPVTVTVGDAVDGDADTVSFTLTVSTRLRLDAIADVSVPKGATLPEVDVRAHGGTPGYTYEAPGLPTGVNIDPTTGAITGTPTGALGAYKVTVTATDSTKATASETFTIVELPASGGPAADDPLAGLAINEVKATGTPADDWVELYNTDAALTGASVSLEDTAGDTYRVPAQDIAAHGYVVVDGAALEASGFDLAAKDSLYLTESDGTLLDKTSWASYAPTSWARTTDGTGRFAVSAFPTKGAANSGAPVIHPNDLLVSEVNYDNNSTDYYEYSEVTNTTDHPIDFSVYGLTVTKSGAVMTLHDPADTSGSSPLVDPVIPAHGTLLMWWDENQYLGVKTTAEFLSNYGLPASTPVVLVQGFSSMANSGGDHSYYISVSQGSTPISQAWVDTPCAANTLNGAAVCTATNGNYAEHYAVPADRTDPVAAVWYNSLHAQGDDINFPLRAKLSTPGTVDLEQLGFTRAVKIASATGDAVTLHNSSDAAVDLADYVLQKNAAGATYTLPAGTTIAAGADLVVDASDSGLTFAGDDYVTLLAPRGFAYSDGIGIADTTGPLLKTLPYDASSGDAPVIDPTTGLPLPPAGGLYRPAGISALNGTVYVANTGDNVLAAIANGSNTIVAGSLSDYGDKGDEGPADKAQLYQPGGVAEDTNGNVFIADSGDNVIRKITPDGIIHRFAGTGVAGGAGSAVTSSSTPLTVNLWHPNDVAVDGSGNVFIADTSDNRVLEVTSAGAIKVVAGTGKGGYTGDGAAAATARLSQPGGVAVDAHDNVYIADSSNNVIRRVDASTGVITTVAGDYAAGLAHNGCLGAYAGDGGPATSAQLNDPQGVALDGAGDLFIADTFNHTIREVTADGTISTLVNVGAVAGAGNASPVGNGALPAKTKLNTPFAVAVDPVTNAIYIADTKNNAIDQVVNAAHGGSAAGPVEPADQVAVTGSGKAASACAVLANGPVTSQSAPSVTGTRAVGSTLTAAPGRWTPTPDSFTYQWLRDGVAIAAATKSTYKVTAQDGGHLLAVSVTAVKEDYASASATSAAVMIPVPSPGRLTTATPTITGTVKVGAKVTARPGTWKAGSAAVTSFGYRWLRNGVAIAGARASVYTLVPADYGKRISVTVTGSHAGYTTASVTSAAHAVAAGTLTTSAPRIVGKAKVGRRLTARAGTWKAGAVVLRGTHLRYRWFANGKRIAGATRATYKIARKYKGKRLTVRVTGWSAGYATVTRSSVRTPAVKAK